MIPRTGLRAVCAAGRVRNSRIRWAGARDSMRAGARAASLIALPGGHFRGFGRRMAVMAGRPLAIVLWMAGVSVAAGAAEGFHPDDPLFLETEASGFRGQWYLRDARIPEVWKSGITGRGVRIGVVDNHFGQPPPDLAAALGAEPDRASFGAPDIRDEEGDSAEVPPGGKARWVHGHLVSGIAAARGGDGGGICGAAPQADLSWIRLGPHNIAGLLDAIEYGASGSRTIAVKNFSIGPVEPYHGREDQGAVRRAFRETADAGMLHVVAAGNYDGDCGKSLLCASPHVVVVGACDPGGKPVDWSASGGAVVVSADVSPPDGREPGMVTTGEAVGGGSPFTTEFGGTSAAAPLVSGLLALAREADSSLSIRAVKHLLARTSRPADGEEVAANAAGVRHSPRTGFGRIDAARFVEEVRRRPKLSPLLLEPDRVRDDDLGFSVLRVSAAIPDGDPSGLALTFSVEGDQPLEEVEIYFDLRHTRRGDLNAWLESPSGTRRPLFAPDPPDRRSDLRWIFVTHAFWGENPRGEWKLTIIDPVPGESGECREFGWRMRMGTLSGGSPAD